MTNTAVMARVMLLGFVSACSASPDSPAAVAGSGATAGRGGASGVAGLGGFGGFGGDDNSLTALITEPPSQMAVEVVTIRCAGECKQVLAIATGGNDPYTFTWNDGATSAAREICADDDTTFSVTVTDTAIVDSEFPYAAQTVTTTLTADVIACPDAVVDAGVQQPDADVELPDASATVDCSPYLENDPTCDTLVRGTDCAGTVMYDLPHPVEAGETACLHMQANHSLSLLAEVKVGAGCQLTRVASTSPLGFGTVWGWLICAPATTRVERVGVSGLDANAILFLRHCPHCGS